MENGILASEMKWVSKNIVAFIPFVGWVHWLTGILKTSLFDLVSLHSFPIRFFYMLSLGIAGGEKEKGKWKRKGERQGEEMREEKKTKRKKN